MSLGRHQWKKHIKNWQQSKLTQKKYCEKHNLNYHTLKYWVCELNKDKQSEKQSGFIEIPLKKELHHSEITITLLNGMQVRISPDFDPENISKLISMLKGLK